MLESVANKRARFWKLNNSILITYLFYNYISIYMLAKYYIGVQQ
jgi:hypothetical protein